MTLVLDVRNLSVSYSGVPAVRDLTFHVNKGEVVALLGPNGAGKSSTLSAIMGLATKPSGTVTFAGHDLLGLSPDRIARLGLALVPEGRHIFNDLTVDENLRLGMVARRSRDGADKDLARVLELFPIVGEFLGRQAGLLSGGQQQQLAIARALVADPDLLLLDEPSLGLAPSIIDTVFDSLDQVRAEGRTIVIVEQRAERTVAFADRSYVMANGELRMTIAEQSDHDDTAVADQIEAAYFGA